MILIHKERAENITSYISDIRRLKELRQQKFLARNIKESWINLLYDEFRNNGFSDEEIKILLETEVN